MTRIKLPTIDRMGFYCEPFDITCDVCGYRNHYSVMAEGTMVDFDNRTMCDLDKSSGTHICDKCKGGEKREKMTTM